MKNVQGLVRNLNVFDRVIESHIHDEEELLQKLYHEIVSEILRVQQIIELFGKDLSGERRKETISEIDTLIGDLESVRHLDHRFIILVQHADELVVNLQKLRALIASGALVHGRDASRHILDAVLVPLFQRVEHDMKIDIEALQKIGRVHG